MEQIETRLDFMENMSSDLRFYDKLANIIKKFQPLDEMVSFCLSFPKKDNDSVKSAENKVHNVMIMNELLESVEELKQIIKDSKIPLIENFKNVNKKLFKIVLILFKLYQKIFLKGSIF